jgi:ABC-2 type transport system permease protein
MRSNILTLTRVFLKNGGDSLRKSKGKKKAIPNAIVLALVMILMISSLGIPFGLFIGEAYKVLAPIGQEAAILGFILTLICMTIFVFGIFYVLNTFYFAKDVEFLLPLPLKPYEIVGAKFITVIIYEYLTEIVLLAPALIVYGIKSNAGILFYIYSIIIFLIIPVIPIIIAAIIDMIIMRFTNIGKHRDKLRVIGGVFALFIGIGVNIVMQKAGSAYDNDQQLIQRLLTDKNSLLTMVSNLFPSAKFAALSLSDAASIAGLQNFVLFLIINLVFLGIFMILAQALYFKGVVGGSETFSRRKKLTGAELEKGMVQNSSIKAFIIKELRLLVRTPAYFLNCVIMNFLWPVFLLIPFATQKGSFKEINSAVEIFQHKEIYGVVLAVTFAVSIFMAATNGITSTSISREGQSIFINKYLPISYRDQLIAKVLTGVILSGAGLIIVLCIGLVVMKPPIYLIILMLLASLIGVFFISLTGIYIDLKFPKLNWDNEQKAVKQNFNLMINMFFGIAVAGLFVFLMVKFQLNMWYVLSIIFGIFGLLDVLLYYLLGTLGERLFNKIEP